jgi:hypothetical protein
MLEFQKRRGFLKLGQRPLASQERLWSMVVLYYLTHTRLLSSRINCTKENNIYKPSFSLFKHNEAISPNRNTNYRGQ